MSHNDGGLLNQLQCPECGVLTVQLRRSAVLRRYGIAFIGLFWVGLFSMLLLVPLFGGSIVVGGLLWLLFTVLAPAAWLAQHLKYRDASWYQRGYQCLVCGHRWVQRPGQQLQPRIDPARRRELVERLKAIEDQRHRSSD